MSLPVPVRLNYGPMRMRLYETAPTLEVSSGLLDGDLCGIYDAARDVIIIDRRMTYTRKRCTLVHELVHRAHGDIGHQRELRCRLQTALLLVDRDAYIQAERMYEGDRWLIADELDLTVDVIDDYRLLLRYEGVGR
ncbi:hypothetical protein [Bifidobacterium catulorum]|uniref:IrrE N-terminal-like domain-containing protein n=1 Tax=Bifidobacterium catulorum TaxID=1630173 RepID=A0A2U2MUB3_9BIFI|nr:hypothetical protein [Bifidobacterium catulorum]PWG60463.1 hypothetical protein DF200_02385 [Bifidobacterium catulorum]